MDFLDVIVAVAGIAVLIYLGYFVYSIIFWGDAAIRRSGIQTTAVIVKN